MRKINDRLTVYTCEEIRQIVSDLIGEDAFKYFTYANGYDNDEEPHILFAQYFPTKQKTMIVYKITSDYLRRRDLSKYTFMEAKTTGKKVSEIDVSVKTILEMNFLKRQKNL